MINEGNLPKAIVVIGPTAVGKTEYAIEIAERYNGEIVSADSMQIYRGLDIGTAKPSVEELARVPHHMIGFVDPAREYSAAKYREDAAAIIFDIRARGRLPVICGGTGLYINALIYDMDFSGTGKDEAIRGKYEELADVYGSMYIYGILKERDPEGAERIHPNNKKRIIRALERLETGGESEGLHEFERSFVPGSLFDPVLILLERSREELLIRIDARVDRLIATGLEEEVRGLIDAGLGSGHISMLGIGYKELMRYL
ncbi:MAG: tRNA (adenosine(37)-N6)-dimethylallyltransferase MiaA, partial [Clostridiales Family XIII bacterium]|nr:tRNA (adenosine(37)-N6)-dimethylallyltransferase MiaA [Clostridiales Family XIII bacterium]